MGSQKMTRVFSAVTLLLSCVLVSACDSSIYPWNWEKKFRQFAQIEISDTYQADSLEQKVLMTTRFRKIENELTSAEFIRTNAFSSMQHYRIISPDNCVTSGRGHFTANDYEWTPIDWENIWPEGRALLRRRGTTVANFDTEYGRESYTDDIFGVLSGKDPDDLRLTLELTTRKFPEIERIHIPYLQRLEMVEVNETPPAKGNTLFSWKPSLNSDVETYIYLTLSIENLGPEIRCKLIDDGSFSIPDDMKTPDSYIGYHLKFFRGTITRAFVKIYETGASYTVSRVSTLRFIP